MNLIKELLIIAIINIIFLLGYSSFLNIPFGSLNESLLTVLKTIFVVILITFNIYKFYKMVVIK